MGQQPKRRIVLIDRTFQFRQIGAFVALQVAVLLLFGGSLYLFLDSELGASLASVHATYRTVKAMLFPIVLTVSLLNLLLSALSVSLFVLYASHKIAGPLYRFHAALEEMRAGNLRPLTAIRKGDQLLEASEALTALAETLSRDIGAAKQAIAEIDRIAGAGTDGPALRSAAERAGKALDRYRH